MDPQAADDDERLEAALSAALRDSDPVPHEVVEAARAAFRQRSRDGDPAPQRPHLP